MAEVQMICKLYRCVISISSGPLGVCENFKSELGILKSKKGIFVQYAATAVRVTETTERVTGTPLRKYATR